MSNFNPKELPTAFYTPKKFFSLNGVAVGGALQVFVNGVKTQDVGISNNNSWTQYSISNIAVPAGATVKVGIALNAAGSAWTQFDDFFLLNNNMDLSGI